MFSERKTRKRKNSRWKLFTALFVLFLCFFAITEVYARVGGGHYYSSSGSSSRSSSSRGGSYRSSSSDGELALAIFDLIVFTLRLVKRNPLLGIPLLLLQIALVAFLIFVSKKYGDKLKEEEMNEATSYIRRSAAPYVADKIYKELLETDGGFNQYDFQAWVKNLFCQVQDAWSQNDISQVQHFLSDGLYEQLAMQTNLMEERGIIDYQEGLDIQSVAPIKLEKSNYFQVLHVQIKASGVNYRKNKHSGDVIDGSLARTPFSEIWSFVRRSGSATKKEQYAIADKQCPNCGTPLSIERITACPSCSALVRSGSHGWVLSGITQSAAAAFAGVLPTAVPNQSFTFADDPLFNEQMMRDFGSVVFWRHRLAEYKADGSLLGKVAAPAFIEKTVAGYKRNSDGLREAYTKIGAGGIAVATTASNIDGRDYVLLNITWQGVLTLVGGAKELYYAGPQTGFSNLYEPRMSRTFYHSMLLSRKHGAQTKVDFSLSSAACPSCGAPQTEITAKECPYCGYVPNLDSGAWFLEDILPLNSPEYKAALEKFSQGRNVAEFAQSLGANFDIPLKDLMKLAVLVSGSDGTIAATEMEALKKFAGEWGISQSDLLQMMVEVKGVTDYEKYFREELKMPRSANVFKVLVQMALVDGVLEESEMEILRAMGRVMKYSERDLQMMIKQERNAMRKMGKEVKVYVKNMQKQERENQKNRDLVR
ncbi:MAG: TIM44-like domain-containing protein [Candidatus Riflebacteria bacterium]|nr:TIM44-like domain-containing protein [Candidatus Riflebacteria bacterium]